MTPFDLPTAPLAAGVTLIEASAGTGKTFTITGLILRFIIEQRLPIRAILAVTFTNAATEELRDRVRTRLQEALKQLREQAPVDPVLCAFVERGGDQLQAMRDLDVAVQSFDEAQIFTIHGFCQRVLRENAFESGVPFDLELVTDSGPLFEEVRRDFWRSRFYEASPLVTRLARAGQYSAETWAELLRQISTHPGLRIIPDRDPLDCTALAVELTSAFQNVCAEWVNHRASVTDLLETSKDLSRDQKRGLPKSRIPEFVAGMDELASQDPTEIPAATWTILSALSQSHIAAATKPKATAPQHPFFALCETFEQLRVRFFHQLNQEMLLAAEPALARLKQQRGIQTYDDLLQRLRKVLASEAGEALAETLRAQYRVALIDEFQDTDPIQHEIFQRIFAREPHQLYLIGDPKQAIYSFRGADLFTYLSAAEGADRRSTLTTSFRAEPALMAGLNTLFSHVAQPFRRADIDYRQLASADRVERLINEHDPSRLRFRWLPAREKEWPISDAEETISEAVVADLIRLFNCDSRIGSDRVRYQDFAILTLTKKQADHLQSLLRARGIKSVLQTDANVFETEEAVALLRVSKAVLEPRRDALLRAALSTPLLGITAAAIHALGEDQTAHQRWLEHFRELNETWAKSGFMAMFRAALVRFDVRSQIIARPGGERELTNYLHLAELLHEAETQQSLAPESLLEWLRRQIHDPATQEAYQLRLESDEDAVTIMTVHKSKGLEFPVVFCPFLWKSKSGPKDPALIFHDPETRKLTYDLRDAKTAPNSANAYAAEREEEMLRLLYVAVTRAKNCVYIYGGPIKEFAVSPLHHLLAAPDPSALMQAEPGAISLSEIVEEDDSHARPIVRSNEAQSVLCARAFAATIPHQRMIASFTGLVSGQHAEDPERDPVSAEEPLAEPLGEFSPLNGFERGARAGLFFHELLEHLDFQAPHQVSGTVARHLTKHGFSAREWREPLTRQLSSLLDCELAPGLRLSAIGPAARLQEMAFFHPLKTLHPVDLQTVFLRHQSDAMPDRLPESLGRLRFDPVAGWLRGFIDLLIEFEQRYYLIDWKSNWLGARLTNYERPAMEAEMQRHAYHLQYHLYTVATDLFLRQRLPNYAYERNFGGVIYVFLRGVDASQPTRGLYSARPAASLIEELGELFTGGKS